MIFKNFFLFLKKKIRSLYLNSAIYDKKISSFNDSYLKYRPSPSLLDCLIKYNKKKINIENYSLNEIWIDQKMTEKNFDNLKFIGCGSSTLPMSSQTEFINKYKIKLSKTSTTILEKTLLSFSYPPTGMSDEEFIDLKEAHKLALEALTQLQERKAQ